MSYFKLFPNTYYKSGEKLQIVTNILASVDFDQNIKKNQSVYITYEVKDSDTPEIIAHKIYGDPEAHWIILHLNNIINPFFDWPMKQVDVKKYCDKKYGQDHINDTHHYQVNGIVVDSDYPDAIEVTNFEHEENINDKKRLIKLLDPKYIDTIQNQLKRIMS